MSKPNALQKRSKRLQEEVEDDTSASATNDATTAQPDSAYILNLPRELRAEILSYVVRQGEIINMKEGTTSREKRKWNHEVERLKDPNWKRPRARPSPLGACREIYVSGVETFWSGNTFNFATLGELQQFLNSATNLAKKSMKSVDLFHDYPCPPFSIFPHDLHAGTHAPGPWTDWPPSLRLLSALPKLQTLDISTNTFPWRSVDQSVLDDLYGAPSQGNAAHVRHISRDLEDLGGLYTRDVMLKTIPESIIGDLKSLIIRYESRMYAPDAWTPPFLGSRHFDILPYVRDLHSGVWDIMPHPHDESEKFSEYAHTNTLWMEARAAAHFAPDIVPANNMWSENKIDQWCTWSMEWGLQQYKRENPTGLSYVRPASRQPAPRPFEELFEIVEGKLRVREEHSWENYLEDHPEEAQYDQ